jgi:zinc transporter ZupT
LSSPREIPLLYAALLSLIAGLATGIGGGIVALLRRFDMRTYDALLGFAAGVMTAIATLGLVAEAWFPPFGGWRSWRGWGSGPAPAR